MADNCSKHPTEVAGISDMRDLAEKIGNLHYKTLTDLLFNLSKKFERDAKRDYDNDREKLASALQYLGMSLFESSLRAEKVWKISKPFMTENNSQP